MKKIIFFLIFINVAAFADAQILKTIYAQINFNVMKAKEGIDKYIAKDSAKPEGWYYKGKVYNEISKHDSLKTACNDCKMEAFEAFKRYQTMDKKNSLMASKQNVDLFDIYNGFFSMAANAYNQKDYTGAFTNFKKAAVVEEYIKGKGFAYNGFKFPAFDTLLITDLAITARVAHDDSEAIFYYRELTDANLTDSQYVGNYEYVVDYYKKNNDHADFETALAKGKKLFPKDKYWSSVEDETIESTGTKEQVLDRYATATAADPSNYLLNYNYSVSLYNYIYANDNKSANKSAYVNKAFDQINKTLAINSTAETNLLMAKFLYNRSYDYADSVKKAKGWETVDFQKRKRLKDAGAALVEQAIPYDDAAIKQYKAMALLTDKDKANYDEALSLSKNLYALKHGQKVFSSPVAKTTTTTTVTAPVNQATATPVITSTSSDANVVMEQFYYNRSRAYQDSVKQAKGWETADFQKRKRLKDSVDAAMNIAIPYGDAAVKMYEAMPSMKDSDKTNYIEALTLLQKMYTSKKDAAKAAQYSDKLNALGIVTPVKTSTTTVSTWTNTTTATTVVTSSAPDANVAMEQSLYDISKAYLDSVKKAKGWETADFQKRKRLKDSADLAATQAITYGEAATKQYEAMPELKGKDKADYIESLILLKDLYTEKKDATKAAEYDTKLKAQL